MPTDGDTYRIVALFFGLFFPPIAVLMVDGLTLQLLINILLTLFGFLPGIIHAFWIVLKAGSAVAHAMA